MHKAFKRLGIFAAAFTASITLASPAHAGYDPYDDGTHTDDDTLFDSWGCYDPYKSEFPFTIYYNSNLKGAYRNLKYGVYDFNALHPGGSDPSYHALKFCYVGASSPWPGSGQPIKNNAASARNDHYKYVAHVYYNSGYRGAQDILNPYESRAQFVNVYNENASFRYWVP
jgi:hypothetical protein